MQFLSKSHFFHRNRKIHSIYEIPKNSQIAKIILKKHKVGVLILPDFRTTTNPFE
jgi:hypothetical protein